MTDARRGGPAASPVMHILEQGVPLTLLLDLLSPADPHRLYHDEDADLGWIPFNPPTGLRHRSASPVAVPLVTE